METQRLTRRHMRETRTGANPLQRERPATSRRRGGGGGAVDIQQIAFERPNAARGSELHAYDKLGIHPLRLPPTRHNDSLWIRQTPENR